jgi:hypothetical protein
MQNDLGKDPMKTTMDEHKAATSVGCRNGGIRVIVFLLGIPLLLILLIVLILWIPLPGLVSDPGSQSRHVVAAITVGITGFSILFALIAYLRTLLKVASHCMDEYFQSKGFRVSKSYGYGRRFFGTMEGVPVEGVLLPSYYLQPWRLNITMHIGPHFLGAISNRKPIINCYCKPYHTEGPLFPYYTVSTEPHKMDHLLHHPTVEEAIHTILTGHTKSDTWEVRFDNEKTVFRSIHYVFYPTEMETSLDAFFTLLRVYPTLSNEQ